ncbi:hypothetical protein M8J76_000775 [Diaphorina citri]|nr:hypothetical protein M8J76_000775 [Diaphorina citri]KAI5715204.1 hypothetical protein M8J77_012151 [Diaphorina citri]
MLLLLLVTLCLRHTQSVEISTPSSPVDNSISSTTYSSAVVGDAGSSVDTGALVEDSGSSIDTSAAVVGDGKSSWNNATVGSTDDDRDLKQSLAGLDIRWGGERGNHNLVLGKKQERDELLLRYVCKKDGRWLRTATDEVTWPLYGRKPTNHIIHYVEALDQEVGGRGGFASITRGGVSHKNVTVTLKSQRNYGLNFIVSIYGSPEYHETYEDTIVINEKPDQYGVVQAYKPNQAYLPPSPTRKPATQYGVDRPSQQYGIDPPALAIAPPASSYRPQLGWETDHHANQPSFAHNHVYAPVSQGGYAGQQFSSEDSEEEVVESANQQGNLPGIYIEQHQYKPTYNPYKPTGAFKPQSNLNAEAYLSSKPKPNIYTHNVEAYKPGEYYVHHQQNYYAKPQKYQ